MNHKMAFGIALLGIGIGCNADPIEAGDDAIDTIALPSSSGSLLIATFKGSSNIASTSILCNSKSSASDTGSASYSLRVGDLTSTNKTRLETAIANGTATMSIAIAEYLDVLGETTANYDFTYELTFTPSGATSIVLASGGKSNSVSTDTAAPDYSSSTTVSANLASSGVHSSLSADDVFQVTFSGNASVVCRRSTSFDQAAAKTYLANIYGTAKAKITGTY